MTEQVAAKPTARAVCRGDRRRARHRADLRRGSGGSRRHGRRNRTSASTISRKPFGKSRLPEGGPSQRRSTWPTAPQVDDGLARLQSTVGSVDLLVNNAGLWGPIDDLWKVDPEDWWQTMEVHVGGTFHCCRAVLPGMVQRGAGRIVSIVSHAGVHRWPTCSAYSVSKAAVIKLMENLSFETRRQGVKVFAFHPGLMAAGLGKQAIDMQAPQGSPADRAASWIRSEFAAGRSVSPERAARFLVGLAAGDADRLSGRYLTVFDDLRALQVRAEEIADGDLLTLRLRD